MKNKVTKRLCFSKIENVKQERKRERYQTNPQMIELNKKVKRKKAIPEIENKGFIPARSKDFLLGMYDGSIPQLVWNRFICLVGNRIL